MEASVSRARQGEVDEMRLVLERALHALDRALGSMAGGLGDDVMAPADVMQRLANVQAASRQLATMDRLALRKPRVS